MRSEGPGRDTLTADWGLRNGGVGNPRDGPHLSRFFLFACFAFAGHNAFRAIRDEVPADVLGPTWTAQTRWRT